MTPNSFATLITYQSCLITFILVARRYLLGIASSSQTCGLYSKNNLFQINKVGFRNRSSNRYLAHFNIFTIPSCPISRINATLKIAVKTGIRPINDILYPTLFNRIEVQIIHMGCIISVIAYGMFPETSLPNTPLTTFNSYL